MKRLKEILVSLLVSASLSLGCAAQQPRIALYAEQSLMAGSAMIDQAVDDKIHECERRNLRTALLRTECIKDVAKLVATTNPIIESCVAALRAFWAAKAAGDQEGQIRAIAALTAAISALPDEYFRGLKQ